MRNRRKRRELLARLLQSITVPSLALSSFHEGAARVFDLGGTFDEPCLDIDPEIEARVADLANIWAQAAYWTHVNSHVCDAAVRVLADLDEETVKRVLAEWESTGRPDGDETEIAHRMGHRAVEAGSPG